MINFSKNLSDIMKEKNINQTNLSEITGISTKTIQRYIKGESSPDLKNLEKIAKALEIPIEKLLGIKTLKVEFIEQNNKIEIPYYPETYDAAGAGAYNYEEAPKSKNFTKTFR